MRTIRVECICGASFSAEDSKETYIFKEGQSDENGDVFLIDKQYREWVIYHKDCLNHKK